MERAVRTYLAGDALLTSLGDGTGENIRAIEAGTCGLRSVESPCPLAAAGKIDPAIRRRIAIDGYTPLESAMIHCARQAAAESDISLADEECLLVFASTKGNIELLRDNPVPPDEAFLHTLAERVAACLGAKRSPVVISNACISGLSALIVARRLIRNGFCRHAVVIGGDSLTEFVATGFLCFKSVSPGPCRPYDGSGEHGLSLGEAVGALVLTSDPTKAKQPAVVLEGGAVTNDANHISGPSRTGDGLHYAIEEALREAAVNRADISFINAHGTGTAYNDAMESKAIALSGLSDCPMNGLKGYIGHTLGASGVVESILCASELRSGRLFGTAGFTTPGTPEPLNLSSEPRSLTMKHCLKTASGFGGCNAAALFGLAPFVAEESDPAPGPACRLTASFELPADNRPFAEMIRAQYKALEDPNMKFYKMDNLAKAGYVAAEYLLRDRRLQEKYTPTQIAVVLENRSASLDCDLNHQHIVNEHHPEGTSPAVFVYTLPNVVAGEICIRHHIQGENTFFIDGKGDTAERYARLLIERRSARAVIYGICEYLTGNWQVRLNLLEAEEKQA